MKKRVSNRTAAIFGIGWLILMYALYDVRPLAFITNSWKTTTHINFNFSIEHPRRWVAHKYGESGFRSKDDVVIRLSSDMETAFNSVWIQHRWAENPTLDDAVNWGEDYLQSIRQNAYRSGNTLAYEEFDYWEDNIHGVPISRRVYQLGSLVNEDVYIARSNDMIIITIETSQDQYENHKPEFDRLVESFSPLE